MEDSEDDALIVQRLLRNGGYEVASERVDTPAAFTELLAKHPWDVILCDYSMPHFDGLSALRIVREREIDVPFILVSGTIGEDTAVLAMKEGASDYLIKQNLARLVPAVERELREANVRRERRRVERALILSEEKFRTLFERIPVGLFHVAQDGRILEANPALVELLGVSDHENALTRNVFEMIPDPQGRQELTAKLETAGEGEFEFELRRTDGKALWVRGRAHVVQGPSGEFAYYEGSLEDVTLRKSIEDVARRCRTDHLWEALFRTFGRGAAAVLYQAGLSAGGTTYDFLKRAWGLTDDESAMHALEEHLRIAGLLTLGSWRVDRDHGRIAVEFTRSFEANVFSGGAEAPVCHFLRGLFCGIALQLLSVQDLVADETACEGRGDRGCRIQVHRRFERPE